MTEAIIPGALADHLDGANFMTGADDHDPGSKAARLALEGGRIRRYGRGYTLTIRATQGALDVITEYAETVLRLGGSFTRAEIRAAQRWIDSL